jgi:hypothetical protein
MTSTNRQLASNILLVHGGTDGSIWTPVIQWLQFQHFNVVASLVYITGCALDTNETIQDILKKRPTPAQKFVGPIDKDEKPTPFLIMQRDKIPVFACPDVFGPDANAIAAAAAPTSATCFSAKITTIPAWRQFPTWYLILSEDQVFHPDTQKELAQRAAPPKHIKSIKASHLGIVASPLPVANFIMQAA